MASNWKTFKVDFEGGMVTSLPYLKHGFEMPGAALYLKNLEVSLEGGYKRVEGYQKFSDVQVPACGFLLVDGSGQTGTSLAIKGISTKLVDGSTITIAGVTGTYTVSSSTFNVNNRSSTLTISPALSSSPANAASVTVTSTQPSLIEGVCILEDGTVVAKRDGALWFSGGLGWTCCSVPNYGTVTVQGGGQTGNVLNVTGVTASYAQPGDTFTVTGLNFVYTVVSVTGTTPHLTLTLDRSLSTSPTNGVAVTFRSAGLLAGSNNPFLRHASFRLGSVEETAFCDGTNRPFKINSATKNFTWYDGLSSDVIGATSVSFVRSTLFFSKNSVVTYSAPASDTNFNPANGAGSINVGDTVLNIIAFKNTLIIFTENSIKTITGSSSQDFTLNSLTTQIGCLDGNSVLEVGGDILFLAKDGVRFLSDTERAGELTISVVSSVIREEFENFITPSARFFALRIQGKAQYRLFNYEEGILPKFNSGYCGVQSGEQGMARLQWSYLQGFKVRCGDSKVVGKNEIIVFSNNTGIVYSMDQGNNFDGEPISWILKTPYIPVDDSTLRKTFYKMYLYMKLQNTFSCDTVLTLDFNKRKKLQPGLVNTSSSEEAGAIFGNSNSIFNTSKFGKMPEIELESQLVGNGFTFSLTFSGQSSTTETFAFQNLVIEYSTRGRN